MNPIDILGYMAGIFVVGASLPQIIQIIKTKRTHDISLPMYISLNLGVFLWLVYGIITNQPALIISNAVFQVFNIIILTLKIRHK